MVTLIETSNLSYTITIGNLETGGCLEGVWWLSGGYLPNPTWHQKFESIYTFGLFCRQGPNCNGVWEIRGFNQCNHNDFYHWDGTSVAFLCKKNKLFHTNFFGQGSLTPPPSDKCPNFFRKKVWVRWLTPPPFSDNVRNLEVFFFEGFPNKVNLVFIHGFWPYRSSACLIL